MQRRRNSMALRISCWKTVGLRILLIASLFGFICGILIYVLKDNRNQSGEDGRKFAQVFEPPDIYFNYCNWKIQI